MATDSWDFSVATQNVQVGIGSRRQHHLLAHSWRYLLPHPQSLRNLEAIAQSLQGMDLVGLNEVDAGSFRSQYLNQAVFLAERSGLPYWAQQRTRDWGDLAQHSNSLLSRWPILDIERHQFTGTLKGRGLLRALIEVQGRQVQVIVTHLALAKPGRLRQIRQLLPLLRDAPASILLGDLNCGRDSAELRLLRDQSGLQSPSQQPATFPSWAPQRRLDHILISPELLFVEVWTEREQRSDHLPLFARLRWQDPSALAMSSLRA
ncbi:endonuclease/exonuclease/phosphatase family protein [Candidatus Igneacidithiobacillus taiwanensis]|uniref:endonuclease/exonuclease/phosphatase family protein n=1 Tax=Candidatus Igneacidithiobacillus taiwanensis TaxID=1945924 RepID=UPI002899AF7B|nr:endonuclease/exonuclease/phosphatase family protein [Candidatus Igneacidithiobacillus taiwanensis]MCE5360479.1 endonuclease/exonuclease/phosphatase family protein [Acidithiobacillus sp.]